MTPVPVGVMRLPHAEGLPLPDYATGGAAGVDLMAACAAQLPILLIPGARVLVPTGLCFSIPFGYEGQVRPRSGLALRLGITVLNAPGTIDSDFRGEVKVILIHLGCESHRVERGDRVAQLVLAPVARFTWVEGNLDPDVTGRGVGGFGSTGG